MIGSTTDLDWFRFANSSTLKNIRIKLTNLPANYNLRLYNGSTLKASSSNTGTANETIIVNNASVSSNYRVRGHGASGAFSTTQCYTLSIEVGATPFAMPEGNTEAVAGEGVVPEIFLFPNPASSRRALAGWRGNRHCKKPSAGLRFAGPPSADAAWGYAVAMVTTPTRMARLITVPTKRSCMKRRT